MTRQTSMEPLVTPWRSVRFLASVALIPLLTLVGMLLWQDNDRTAFRVVQLCFGWAVVFQIMVVLWRVFEHGWYEFFAYLLHFVAIGAASLTVTFRFEQYPLDLLYDQMALIGMSGQLMIGTMALASRPLRTRNELDSNVLAICAVIVCSAALVKFALYIRYIGISGSYLDVYTEGDQLRDTSPAIIRILAAGAPLIGLLTITQPGQSRWIRSLGVLAILLEFAIGIRGRPLFIIISALVLIQQNIKITIVRKIQIILLGISGIIALGAIGYFREQYNASISDYFWIVLESLFGIFEAGVFGAQIPDTTPIVVGQIWPILVPTPLGSVDTVAKLLTSTFTPVSYNAGYGYSSSALTETVMLLGPVVSAFAYPLIVFGILVLIKTALTSRYNWAFLYGACTLPIAFYIWRAELWQLAVPAIKALPFIVVLLGAEAYARLGRGRAVLRRAPPAL